MAKSRYYYNLEACRYERMRWTFGKVSGYIAGLLAVSSLFLCGIVLISDQLTESKFEKKILTENQALRSHEQTLSGQLREIESVLTTLKEKDRSVHNRLFDDKTAPERFPDENEILMADAGYFGSFLNTILTASKKLLKDTKTVNSTFQQKIEIQKTDTVNFQSVPTLHPIIEPDFELIISGFGMRINPFHKGNYFHPGIDFSAPRGTPVIATASGSVILVKRSDLQAGYGNYLEIDHGNGYKTRYAHLDEIQVKPRQEVNEGMIIGTVGNSGGSIAPHIHYEILFNDKNVDPVNYLVEGLSSERYNLLFTISTNQNQSLD